MFWSVAELLELGVAIRSVPDSFAKRRVLQRLEREEIDVKKAIDELWRSRSVSSSDEM
jgi:hypothetical protein